MGYNMVKERRNGWMVIGIEEILLMEKDKEKVYLNGWTEQLMKESFLMIK